LRVCAEAPHALYVDHCEALAAWDAAGLRGWECWHFDAHPDLGEPGPDSPLHLPLGRRADHLHSGNFLLTALREGILSSVHWVLPSWMPKAFAQERLDGLEPALAASVFLHPWREAAGVLLRPHRVDISFSPAFTPLEALGLLADFLPVDTARLDDFMDRLLQERVAALSGLPSVPPFRPDVSSNPAGTILYHGSAVLDLECLRGDPLFLSPSPAVAASFGLPLWSEDGWIHGVDHLSGPMPVPYLVVPPGREKTLEAPMALYRVRAAESCCPMGGLHGYEYASPAPHPALLKTVFPSVRHALESYGVQIGVLGETRFDPALRAAALARRGEVEDFLEMPLEAVFSIPALEGSLLVYLASVAQLPVQDFPAVSPRVWRYLLDRVLLPAYAPLTVRAEDAFHGLRHSRETARAACFLALSEGISPLAPMLAACLHDAARADDEPGQRHARDGAWLAEMFLKAPAGRALPLAETAKRAIVRAVAGHATTARTRRPVSACLQDADRLRLAWSDGVRRNLFSTKTGLGLALSGP
jgi:hypothetical protein